MALYAALISGTRTLGRRVLPFEEILQYQFAKVDEAQEVHTVFLGDSSLGNAIDVTTWERLTGNKALSLALTGWYGYAGPYVLLSRLLDNGAPPPNVVIFMLTGGMMRRPVADEAFDSLAPPSNIFSAVVNWWHFNMNYEQLLFSFAYIAKKLILQFKPNANIRFQRTLIENDYVKQGKPIKIPQNLQPWKKLPTTSTEKLYFLEKNMELCKKHNINCYYMYGPLIEPLCNSKTFFYESTKMISSAGFQVLTPQPICIPPGEVGDSDDHVAPYLKKKYTERYVRAYESAIVKLP
jgi:hypothetical protein